MSALVGESGVGLTAYPARTRVIDCYDLAAESMRTYDGRRMEQAPWQRIAAYLEAIESERTMAAFAARALSALDLLFDFDYAFFVVTDAREIQNVSYFGNRHFSESLLRDYFSHYVQRDPVLPLLPHIKLGRADWTKYDKDGFTTDFVSRTGSKHAFALSNLVETGGLGVIIVLNRGGAQEYAETDMMTAAALYPHLHNLSSAVLSPVAHRGGELARSFDAAGLTSREREVALLLCERLSVGEIADKLFISRKTAAKHLEHIYLKLGLHGKRDVYEQLLGAPREWRGLSIREIKAPYDG